METRNAEAGSGGSDPFFEEAEVRKITLPHRLFDLKSNLAKNFCLFSDLN